jgi:hypothetical protein
MYKGKPVPNAFVDFTPANGREATGETDDQGHFVVHYDKKVDGATAGKNKVSVRPKPTAFKQSEPGIMAKNAMSKEQQDFFAKYSAANSKIEVTIDKDTPDLKLDWN